MGDKLDSAVISISIFYIIMSLVLTGIQSEGFSEGVSFNYDNTEDLLNVESEDLPSNLWDNVSFFFSWVGFFFVNAFVFFNITSAPLILNILLNLPRVWVVMWLIRLGRGG